MFSVRLNIWFQKIKNIWCNKKLSLSLSLIVLWNLFQHEASLFRISNSTTFRSQLESFFSSSLYSCELVAPREIKSLMYDSEMRIIKNNSCLIDNFYVYFLYFFFTFLNLIFDELNIKTSKKDEPCFDCARFLSYLIQLLLLVMFLSSKLYTLR